MTRANPLLPAFNAGEASPGLVARVDFQRYGSAAAVLRNLLPLTQGGALRRAGTRHVQAVKNEGDPTELLRFQFSDQQAYVIESGQRYFRFYRNQGRIVAPDTDAAIANGGFASDIAGWDDRSTGTAAIAHDAGNGRLSLVGAASSVAWAEQDVTTGATGVEHVLKFRVLGAPGDSVQLRIGTTSTGGEILADRDFAVGCHCHAFTPTASPFYVQFRNGAAKTLQIDEVSLIDDGAVEVATPYAAADVFSLRRAQSSDVMYLASPGYPIHKLIRFGHSSWSLIEVAFDDGPYLDQNLDTGKTLQASATTGLGITITAAGHAPFEANDVGRLLRIRHGTAEPGWAVVTGFTSATQVTADVRRAFSATTASSLWRLGSWSAVTGYPATLTFFEQRLMAAGTARQPQTFWGSQSADLENFRPDSFVGGGVTVEDDDALDYTLAAEEANKIRWLASGSRLLIGTFGGEWSVTSTGGVITPSDVDVRHQTTHGSADVAPVRIGHVLMFIQKSGRKLRELVFDFDIDGYQAVDRTILADHVTRSGIVAMDYQEEPDSTLWCLRGDGLLAALTYNPQQNVVGWSRHVLGGGFGIGHAVVESLAVIAGDAATGSEGRNEIWITVKRTVNGQTRRYLEFFEANYEGPIRDDHASDADWEAAVLAAQREAFYVDSGLSYAGAPAAVFAGLDHLEGETVKILADGAVHPDRTVSGGAVALDAPAAKVHVGLPYRHRYQSLKLDFGASAGTAIGKRKRLHGLTLVLQDVLEGNLLFGPSSERLAPLPLREVNDPMDSAVPLFTGEVFKEFDGDWSRDARIVLEGEAPGPFRLLALAPELKTNELS